MFHEYGVKINSAQLDLLIKESDVDGNGTIDFQEFLLIMLKIKKGKLGGPAADFSKAAKAGNVGAAASALKERMFGISKKKRLAIERADAERERKRREDEERHAAQLRQRVDPHTGEVLFKRQFDAPIADLVVADYRMDPMNAVEQIIVCTSEGEVTGFSPANSETGAEMLDETLKGKAVDEL